MKDGNCVCDRGLWMQYMAVENDPGKFGRLVRQITFTLGYGSGAYSQDGVQNRYGDVFPGQDPSDPAVRELSEIYEAGQDACNEDRVSRGDPPYPRR